MPIDEENREAYRKEDAYSSEDKADVKRERDEQYPWRTEPEIDIARQKQLRRCLAEALVLSVSSFHGRGFFLQSMTLSDPFARLAAAEAVLGLLIEISFIATFTQRFFGR